MQGVNHQQGLLITNPKAEMAFFEVLPTFFRTDLRSIRGEDRSRTWAGAAGSWHVCWPCIGCMFKYFNVLARDLSIRVRTVIVTAVQFRLRVCIRIVSILHAWMGAI